MQNKIRSCIATFVCLWFAACSAVEDGDTLQHGEHVSSLSVGPTVPVALPIHPASGHGTYLPLVEAGSWLIGEGLRFPVPGQVGDVVHAWTITINRTRVGDTTSARLEYLDDETGDWLPVGAEVTTDDTSTIGILRLSAKVAPTEMTAGRQMTIRVRPSTPISDGGDYMIGGTAFARRPLPAREIWSSIQRGTTEGNVAYDGGDFLHTVADFGFVSMPVSGVAVGDRIAKMGVRLKGATDAQTVQVVLLRSDGDGGSTPIHTLSIVDPPDAWAEYSATLATPEQVQRGKGYYWYVNMPRAKTFLGPLGLTLQ